MPAGRIDADRTSRYAIVSDSFTGRPHLEVLDAPQDGANAGGKFEHAEGFGEVIVGPGVQSSHHVLGGILGGEEENGDRGAFPSEFPNDLDPSLPREHDVQDEEVVVMNVGLGSAVAPVMGHVYGITVLTEPLLQEAGDLFIVFYHEDAHGGTSSQAWKGLRSNEDDDLPMFTPQVTKGSGRFLFRT